MKTNLSESEHTEHMTSSVKDSDILALYDCDENPLAYMIEPKGSVEITDEDSETTKEDLENIL